MVRSGTLSAIMGPSGAGKTTLLAAVSQKSSGEISGEIHMNGHPVDKELMKKMSGFVPQQDLAFESLTVREHLQFMASLKMDRRVSAIQQMRVISGLIQDLGLLMCSKTRLSSLSGGERRRVSLAVQLLTDPPVLICDEPTTGLDSSTAASVINLLRQLTAKGKAVLCSLHQPASGIFEMFDTVTLLVPVGRLAYFGNVNGAKQHFASMNLVCPPAYNTAEYVVTQLNTKPDEITEKFISSIPFIKLNKEIEHVKLSENNNQLIFGIEEKFLKFYSVQPPTKLMQLKWLLWRSILELYRNPQKTFLSLVMYIFTAFLVAIPYIGVKLDQEGIQNVQGLNYSVVTETIFTHAYAVVHTFPLEIPILLREMNDGVYQPAPYYLSKVFLLVPRVILETLLFCLVIHWTVGINVGPKGFLIFFIPAMVSGISSSAYGCCLSAMFENVSTASLLSVPVDFISYCFSGIFLQLSSVPVYLVWLKYISRFYYGLEAMTIMQWINVKNIPCSSNPNIPCISSGEGVLVKYGYNPNNLFFDMSGLLIIFFLLHFIGYLFIKRRTQKQSVY
ncbi:hypothetical protein AAG570_000955 [Ranatra chinensis]|uniref:ABC transporter domain-containing protein n=1 Tax=Ranatra chinensis TaxID=642074 RepID=A0ABD0ZLV2_9HEMI